MIRSRTQGSAQVEQLAAVVFVAVVGLGGLGRLGTSMATAIGSGAQGAAAARVAGAPGGAGFGVSAQAAEQQLGAAADGSTAGNGGSTEKEQAFLKGADALRDALITGDTDRYNAIKKLFEESYGAEGVKLLTELADDMAAQAGAAFYDSANLKGLSDAEIADRTQRAYDAAGPLTAMRVLRDLSEKDRKRVIGTVHDRIGRNDWSVRERKPKASDAGRGFLGSVGNFLSSAFHRVTEERSGNIFGQIADGAWDLVLDVYSAPIPYAMTGIRAVWDGSGLDSKIGTETRALEDITQNHRPFPDPAVSPEALAQGMVVAHLMGTGVISQKEGEKLLARVNKGEPVKFADPLRNMQAALMATIIATNNVRYERAKCDTLCSLSRRIPFVSTPLDRAQEAAGEAGASLAPLVRDLPAAQVTDPRIQAMLSQRVGSAQPTGDDIVFALFDDLVGDPRVAEMIYLQPGLALLTANFNAGKTVMESVAEQTTARITAATPGK